MRNQSRSTGRVSRRNFLSTSGLVLGGTGLGSLHPRTSQAAEFWPAARRHLVTTGDTILFQGDSITDAGRSRKEADIPNHQPALGNGYVWIASADLLVNRPVENLKILNRGISGNKVYQLSERWQPDCLDLLPNLLSILIGVNDLWHTLDRKYNGTVEVYERDFRALLGRTKKALPKIKFVVCEPFVLRCGAVNDKWFPVFDEYRIAARRVAEVFQAAFVPFQAMFDKATKLAPPEHWAADGVHPTAAGAALMADKWSQVVGGRS
jgi:lysophospholipase L1-like esterase